MSLGLRNTIDELIEPHLAQTVRLGATPTGRETLEKLGYTAPHITGDSLHIPADIRPTILVLPIPRNKSPQHHDGRRKAKTAALEKQYGGPVHVVYTGAGEYARDRVRLVVGSSGTDLITSLYRQSSNT